MYLWTDQTFEGDLCVEYDFKSLQQKYSFEDQRITQAQERLSHGMFSLDAMVSGNVGSALYFPMNGVRWLTNPREIALLVKVNNRDRFVAELYHFGFYPRKVGAELLMLSPGSYQMNLDANQGPDSRRIEVKKRTKIAFALPPRQLCRLEIQ